MKGGDLVSRDIYRHAGLADVIGIAILTSMPLEFITGGLGALNLVGLAADVLGIHGAIGGVYTGGQLNRMEQQLERLHARVERLNPYILHADVQEVINTEGRSQRIARLSDVESLLSPVQRSLGEDLLATALITTPAKLRVAFQRDPWDVLIGTRPLNLARRPQVDGEYLPIIFTQESTIYLGWQTIGMMRTTLGTEYSPIEGKTEVADPVSIGVPEMRQSQRSQNTPPSLSKSVAPKNKGNSNRGMIVVATMITVPILLFAAYERLRPQVVTDNQTLAEIKMHHIPAGRFFMGCNEKVDDECSDNEKPGRTVSVRAFFIDRTEVTVEAYAECVKAEECSDYHLTGFEWKDLPGLDIRRKLAEKRPDAFPPDLAWSLNNLGVWLSDLGQREDALKATQQALDIRRKLAVFQRIHQLQWAPIHSLLAEARALPLAEELPIRPLPNEDACLRR